MVVRLMYIQRILFERCISVVIEAVSLETYCHSAGVIQCYSRAQSISIEIDNHTLLGETTQEALQPPLHLLLVVLSAIL